MMFDISPKPHKNHLTFFFPQCGHAEQFVVGSAKHLPACLQAICFSDNLSCGWTSNSNLI